jgi:hypothetical protein
MRLPRIAKQRAFKLACAPRGCENMTARDGDSPCFTIRSWITIPAHPTGNGALGMNRLFIFLIGSAVGACLIYSALTHHLLYTNSGWELVPKTSATFDDWYVDVRKFDLASWSEHRELVAAIIKAEKNQILGDATQSTLEQSARRVVDRLRQ